MEWQSITGCLAWSDYRWVSLLFLDRMTVHHRIPSMKWLGVLLLYQNRILVHCRFFQPPSASILSGFHDSSPEFEGEVSCPRKQCSDLWQALNPCCITHSPMYKSSGTSTSQKINITATQKFLRRVIKQTKAALFCTMFNKMIYDPWIHLLEFSHEKIQCCH